MKSEIAPLLKENEEIALEHGTLVLMPGKPKWVYSSAVKNLQEEEKAKGVAKQERGDPYLQYNVSKE